jgi:hypothetical protein
MEVIWLGGYRKGMEVGGGILVHRRAIDPCMRGDLGPDLLGNGSIQPQMEKPIQIELTRSVLSQLPVHSAIPSELTPRQLTRFS